MTWKIFHWKSGCLLEHSQDTVYGLENRRICCHIINDDLWIPFYMLFFIGDVGGGGGWGGGRGWGWQKWEACDILASCGLPPTQLAFIKMHLGVSVHGKNKPTTAIVCMYMYFRLCDCSQMMAWGTEHLAVIYQNLKTNFLQIFVLFWSCSL